MENSPSTPATSPGPASDSGPELSRTLGPGIAISMVVGAVIGSGIFLKPGQIATDGGSFPLIISAWVIGGIVCLLGGLCVAELALMMPRAGGLYVYLHEAYGKLTAFLYGWNLFFFVEPASNGALAIAFVGALTNTMGWELGLGSTTLIAGSLVVLVAWINFIGVVWGGRFQAVTTIIKAGFVGLMALLPFAMVFFAERSIQFSNYSTSLVSADAPVATRFAVVMLAIMWAYSGWHFVTPVAEEIRNPRRDIPLALLGGIGILTLLYVGANLAFHGVLSMEEMQAAGETVSQTMMTRLLAPYGWGKIGGALVSAIIMCSTLGALNGGMLITPRVTLAMGRSGTFFRSFAYIHPKYRTPAVAIFMQMTMALILLVASLLLVTFVDRFKEQSIFTILSNYTVFCYGPFLMLTIAAVMVLRSREPDRERPFRTPFYPLVPLGFLAFYGWFMYMILQGMFAESLVSIGLILLGIPVFLLVRFLNTRTG
jgi:APA family basic amino acid/polyamine antiporter